MQEVRTSAERDVTIERCSHSLGFCLRNFGTLPCSKTFAWTAQYVAPQLSIRRCSNIYARPCSSPITIELWDSILDYFFINHTLTRARWPDVPPFRSHRQPAALLSEAYSLHRITSPLSTLETVE